MIVGMSSESCHLLKEKMRKAMYSFSFSIIPRKQKYQKRYMGKSQVSESNSKARKLFIPRVTSKVPKKIPRVL